MQRHLARICAIANRKQHFKRDKPLGIAEEITVQREDVLGQALQLLEIQGIASTTLEMVADRIDYPLDELKRFWPDKEALLYDALRYLSQQVDVWRRQLMLNEELTAEQKLLARYTALTECVSNNRYPGCLFIAACTYFPDPGHPIHQLADQQKRAAHDFTHELLTTLEVDDPAMVAKQMELVLEGCLSRMLVNRSQADVDTAHRLAEDILRFAQCRMGGALT
jgi:AcrR family transcriptional regulator